MIQAKPWATTCLVAILLSGCGSEPEQPPVGKTVTVQFRRDALGSGQTPVPPTTDTMNGARVSLTGELVEASSQWFVVKFGGEDHWIPRAMVLLIKVR